MNCLISDGMVDQHSRDKSNVSNVQKASCTPQRDLIRIMNRSQV